MSATVFYFSGTGNSLVVAQTVADRLESARVVALAGLSESEKMVVATDIVVFVFPVYSGGIPVIALKALSRICISGKPYICAIATCDSFAGSAIGILDRELHKNTSQKLAAGWVLCMPGNYTPLEGAAKPSVVASKLAAAEKILQPIVGDICAKKSHQLETLSAPFSWFIEIIWRGFAASVARSDRRFRAAANCTHCGLCAKVCPVGNIRLTDAGRPVWLQKCEQCMACLQFCPVEAIQFCWWTKGRRRYHHPQVTPQNISAQRNKFPD